MEGAGAAPGRGRQAIDIAGPAISNADKMSSFVIIRFGGGVGGVGKIEAGVAQRLPARREGPAAEGKGHVAGEGHEGHSCLRDKQERGSRKGGKVKNKKRTIEEFR